MAIGAIARGDLVVVHSTKLNLHGLYVADSVSGNNVTIAPVGHAGAVAGGPKGQFPTVDKTTEILAVYTASSISA